MEKLLAGLPAQTFTADDSLGWVYQFWQSERKDQVNASGAKITGETLSAVTQLFTEHYMVLFLLHNTIGAWWAGKKLADPATRQQADAAKTEADVRQLVNLPGYAFDYLRFVQGEDGKGGPWRPAAGTFDGWPRRAAELKVLDPCCGSGHFLVAGFDLLVRVRMAEEQLDLPAAVDAVLRDNLFGLELDPRCTQIAAFNLAMAAWKLAGYRPLPPLQIACTGLAPRGKREEWLQLADAADERVRGSVRLGLGALYDVFTDAPTLGSLIDPKSVIVVGAAGFDTLAPALADALASTEKPDTNGGAQADARADAVVAQGLSKASELLVGTSSVAGGGYTLVVTNVPYLGRGKQDETMQNWAEAHEPDAKADLATMFISRSFKWLARGGSAAIVSPQNWLFLTAYKKMRERLLRDESWNFVARLGPNAFQDMNWWAATTTLLGWSRERPLDNRVMLGIDVSTEKQQISKAAMLRGDIPAELRQMPQAGQRNNPGLEYR